MWVPNLRGYGNTEAPKNIQQYDLGVLVRDVEQLIEKSGARELLLLAHDWGGALAWLVAMRRPELIDKLIMCNFPHPACFLRELRHPRQLLKSWYVLFFQLPWLPELLYGANRAYGISEAIRWTACDQSEFPTAVLDIYRENAARPGRLTAMLNWYRGLFRGSGPKLKNSSFPQIEIPTMLLWGTADIALSERTTVGTEEYVARLTLHKLPGVSHWVQQEAHPLVNQLIEDWLGDL